MSLQAGPISKCDVFQDADGNSRVSMTHLNYSRTSLFIAILWVQLCEILLGLLFLSSFFPHYAGNGVSLFSLMVTFNVLSCGCV